MVEMKEILKIIEEEKIQIVRFEQTDMHGISRSKLIPARHFKSKAENGLRYCLGYLGHDTMSNLAEGTGYNFDSGYPDGIVMPDLNTFQVIPWWKSTARVLGEPKCNDTSTAIHPRTLARRQLDELKEMGYSLLSAHEYEFYVVNGATMEPVIDDYNIRSTTRMYECAPFIHQLVQDLPKVGIDIECIENEYGPGQHEITYKPSFGIEAADVAFTYKCSIKEIAKQHNLMASFMSKPYLDSSGSSCHFNHSLWDVDCMKALTYDSESPDNLSEVARHWLAGLIHHIPALSLFMSPTTNCRKRYTVINTGAPINGTWGFDNRTTAFRVKINGERDSYIENRLGSAGSNPYLVLAATIAAGIDGIKNKLPLPKVTIGNAYVPHNVPENTPKVPKTAIEAFVNDEVMRNAFGENFMKCFVAIKRGEIKRASREAGVSISNNHEWEVRQYFKYL